MKNLALILVSVVLLSSCNRKELERAEAQRDSLLAIVNTRDSSLSDFLNTFNDVERNLDSVAAKQGIVSKTTEKGGEMIRSQKEHINDQIAAINTLMDENKKKIAELTRKLKNSGNQNALLKKTIATLNAQLTQKEEELAALNEKLNAANAQVVQLKSSVEDLNNQNASKAKTIEEQSTALHTAYYVVDKSKALQDSKVIDKKGGLLGIGKTSKLSANIDNSKFTRIDYTQMMSIPVNGKNIKIITSHPSDSYTLDVDVHDKNMVKTIIITNGEKFWSASKYLVVVKD